MATDLAALRTRPLAREIPHTVSPGLWTLAWRRLRSDRVGMVSLAIVVLFIVMMILSGTGLIARDWNREVGVNYAPPTFLGAEAAAGQAATAVPGGEAGAPASEYKSNIVDPIGDVIESLRSGKAPPAPAAAPAAAPPAASATEEKSVDPLADVM